MTFEELGVSEPLLRAIADLGFENPMPVQEKVIPHLLGQEGDVVALAQTGTGKTAAFGLPVLQRTDPLNADQVRDGKNGFNFNSPEEMIQKLRQIQSMDVEALPGFKESVIASIRENGARELAERTLAVYERVRKKKK